MAVLLIYMSELQKFMRFQDQRHAELRHSAGPLYLNAPTRLGNVVQSHTQMQRTKYLLKDKMLLRSVYLSR